MDFIAAEAASSPICGRYDSIEKLWIPRPGAFSIVCGARDVATGRRVAMKFLGPGAVGDPYRTACFDREAKVSELLIGKENVVQLAGARDQLTLQLVHHLSGMPLRLVVPFFALERARGSFTAWLLGRSRPRAVYRRLEIMRDVVKGVGRLHRAGYCHRDIKPDNILLFSRNVAKVADLGTCRLHSGIDPLGDTMQYLMPTGDLLYAAPEMFSAAGHDPSRFVDADWFGVGAVMFEAITGQNLYVAMGLRSWQQVKVTIAAAGDLRGYLRGVSTSSSRYPIPATSDFREPWLEPLSKSTHYRITSLVQDLCNFDYRQRLVDFDTIIRRIDIAIIRARRDHDRFFGA